METQEKSALKLVPGQARAGSEHNAKKQANRIPLLSLETDISTVFSTGQDNDIVDDFAPYLIEEATTILSSFCQEYRLIDWDKKVHHGEIYDYCSCDCRDAVLLKLEGLSRRADEKYSIHLVDTIHLIALALIHEITEYKKHISMATRNHAEKIWSMLYEYLECAEQSGDDLVICMKRIFYRYREDGKTLSTSADLWFHDNDNDKEKNSIPAEIKTHLVFAVG